MYLELFADPPRIHRVIQVADYGPHHGPSKTDLPRMSISANFNEPDSLPLVGHNTGLYQSTF